MASKRNESSISSILYFPGEVFEKIFTLASRDDGASALVKYSLVCKTFQAGVRQVTRLFIPYSSRPDENFVKIVKLTPHVK